MGEYLYPKLMFNRKIGIKLPKAIKCKHLCDGEASINGSGHGKYNAKCTVCQIALNTDKLRCYCCNQVYRRRRSINNSLKYKEEMITRI